VSPFIENAGAVWLNSPIHLRGQTSKLSPEMSMPCQRLQAIAIFAIRRVRLLYLICTLPSRRVVSGDA
jgi:hypothetical protein